ncbi:MAG: hypothetical protein JWN86_1983 [Planctomycetota bacterium]|nr:hypothetical protein [Planctomycetota bacterium]
MEPSRLSHPTKSPGNDTDSAPRIAPSPMTRLASIDAYRGFVMLLMMGEVLRFGTMAKNLPQIKLWAFLAHHQEHVPWVGCTLHDLIQPSFSFLVGVALPFSLMSRAAKGQSQLHMTLHAFWRAFVLVALGIFLRSSGRDRTNFTFEDTLTQIGLGYGFLFLLGTRSVRIQWLALVILLVGYWAAFAVYPLPGPDFDYQSVGVEPGWSHHATGLAAHWNKNSNLAWRFDTWFLNLFPRKDPFRFNSGGYATLSFLPTLATMILGLIAGGWLARVDRGAWVKVLCLIVAGLVSLGAGYALGESGLCPVVKRIWTPSWVLFSGGWCFLILALAYAIIDVIGLRLWAFPLIVIGANSIAAYLMAHWIEGFLSGSFKTHLGRDVFQVFGPEYEPVVHGAAVLAAMWLILLWMYRRRIFLRV